MVVEEDKHIAIVTAQSTGEAIFKFNQYIAEKLKYEEGVPQATFTALKEEGNILYCDYE